MSYSLVPGAAAFSNTPERLVAGSYPVETERATIAAGQQLARGSVLGQQSLGTPVALMGGSNAGNGTITGAANGPSALAGTYRLMATSPTSFTVLAPNGDELEPATPGVPYATAFLSFTLNAGGTSFQAGDTATVSIPAGSGFMVLATTSATDGRAARSRRRSTGAGSSTSAP